MDLNFILCVLAALTTLTGAQSYRYMYGGRRRSRPASRMFGSSYGSSRRSRYDPGRRPVSRPFTIPGFGSTYGSPSSSSSSNLFQNNMGFNIGGFAGRAFVDPIAGLYDQSMDAGGLDQVTITGVNDFASFNPAANTRSSFSREANTAMDPSVFNSRQQQQQQLHQNLGTHDALLGSGGLGFQNIAFTTAQNTGQFLTEAPVNSADYTTLDLTGAGTNSQMGGRTNFQQQLGATVPSQNPLAVNQLNGMGSVQFIDASGLGNGAIGIDLTNLGVSNAGIQAAMHHFDMPSGSTLVDTSNIHEILSGHHHKKALQNQLSMEASQFGHESNQLEMGSNPLGLSENQLDAAKQLGLGSNQLGLGFNALGLGSNQLGLGGNQLGLNGNQLELDTKQLDLGQNKIVLDSNNLSNSFGMDGNHVIIKSEKMDIPSLDQANMAAGNQVLLDSSGGEMSILGNGQSLLSNNPIGNELSQLNAASGLQGQMIGVSKDGGTTQLVTSAGEFPASSHNLMSQVGLGSTNQFYNTKEEMQMIGQSQDAAQITSQLNGGLLTQLRQGA